MSVTLVLTDAVLDQIAAHVIAKFKDVPAVESTPPTPQRPTPAPAPLPTGGAQPPQFGPNGKQPNGDVFYDSPQPWAGVPSINQLPPRPANPPGVTIVDYLANQMRKTQLFAWTPIVSIRFRTPPYVAARGANAVSGEYRGDSWHRLAWFSTLAGDKIPQLTPVPGISFIPPKDQYAFRNLNGPASSTLNRFSCGIDLPGHVRLEPDTVYCYNLETQVFGAEAQKQEFSVDIYQPLGPIAQ